MRESSGRRGTRSFPAGSTNKHGGESGDIGDEEQNDQLCHKAGDDALGDLLDLDLADAAGHIQVTPTGGVNRPTARFTIITVPR